MAKKEYSFEQTLKILGITRPTLNLWIEEGRAPLHRRVDKYTIFDAASVLLLKKRREGEEGRHDKKERKAADREGV